MEPQEMQGIIDTLIKKWITDALANASFDYRKFLGHPKTKEAAVALSVAAKDSVSLPFDMDDKGIDLALAALIQILDQYKDIGPVKVGATPDTVGKRWHSREEVEAMLRSVGIDPITVASLIIMLLQYAPMLLDAIKKLFGK